MYEEKNIHHYTFAFRDFTDNSDVGFPISKRLSADVEMSDQVAWPKVLKEFTQFLSGVYGYDITSKVFLQDYDYLGGEADFCPLNEYE